MKSLIVVMILFMIALVVSPFIPISNIELIFNYNVTGCAETEEGMSTRDLTPDNVSPSITNVNGVIYYNRSISHLCCRKAIVNYDFNQSIINIYEYWTGVGCRCICYSKINATIQGLSKGSYLVNVYETGVKPGSDEIMTPKLIVTDTITVK